MHFTIHCNGHTIKVLKLKKIDTQTLEIITKLDNSYLFADEATITLIDENMQQHIIYGKFKLKLSEVSIFRYQYLILDERITEYTD